MAQVDLNEGIKMLNENISFVKDGVINLQDQINDFGEPFEGSELVHLKFLQALLGSTLIHLKIVTDTLSGQQQILQGILNHINDSEK